MRTGKEVRNIQRGVFWALRFLVCITLLLAATPKAGAQEVAVWNGTDIDTEWYDNHTGDNEFTINTAAELAGLAKLVNEGNNFKDKTVRLGANIVLNDTRDWNDWENWEGWENTAPANRWTAIGMCDYSNKNPFSGTFDGQGHVVRGIYISKDGSFQGLFGYIEGGTVMNVGVEESFIGGHMAVGGIAGEVWRSSVFNCYNAGNVSGFEVVGGIAGSVYDSEVSNCYNTGDVSSSLGYVGGIAGQITPRSSVSSCYNTGFVTATNSDSYRVGGIAGFCLSKDPVSNCYYLDLEGSADEGIGDSGGDEDNVTKSMSQDQFASGKVAYLLQAGQADQADLVWGQFLDSDGLPVLGGPRVISDGNSGYTNYLLMDPVNNEYLIHSAEELRVFAELVNAGYNFSGKTVKLANDIELNDTDGWDKWDENTEGLNTWTAIGTYSNNPFSGTFDGQGHVVRGIYISNDKDDQGLFGFIEGGKVMNVGVEESFIKGRYSVGGIAGSVSGSEVSNCYNTGAVSGYGWVGSIAGQISGSSVSNCYNTGVVTATNWYSGGIIGIFLRSSVFNCYNTGTILGKSGYVGGIAGSYNNFDCSISNCYYLEGSADKGIGSMIEGNVVTESKTATEFASGEVANLLGEEWAQAIGGDDFPVLMSHLSDNEKAKKKVYTVTFTYPKDPDKTESITLMKYGNNDQEINLEENDIASIEDYLLTWNPELPIIIDGEDVEVTGTWQLDEIVINTSTSYEESQHGGKLIRIETGGTLTVEASDASVKRLTIEKGGTLLLTQPLTVTNGLMIEGTLQNQWETFCPPTGLTAEEIAINAGGGIWLSTGFRNANNQTWTEVDALTSGTPYIIAGDDVNGTKVSFSHTDEIMLPAATATQLETPEADGILLFQGNPLFAEKEVHDVYALTADGTAFELQEGAYTMRPFECVLTANAATRNVLKSFRLADGNPTGVIELLRGDFRAWGADGLLHLRSAAPADVHIYNVGGSPVTHLPALAGDRTLRLPAGIYLVKYKQTTIKIKL